MALAPAPTTYPELRRAGSLDEALASLEELGEEGAPLAGGTWVMRAPLRGETRKRAYVSLAGIAELARIEEGDPTTIGALATHTRLASLTGPLAALGEAAARSAFPAVRNVATIGGNVACAGEFPEADLVPALLALDASVEVRTRGGGEAVELASYLAAPRPPGELVAAISVPAPAGGRSAFERLTVRGGGEYAVCSVAIARDPDGATRVAVGVVEAVARRSPAAEALLSGKPLDAALAEEAGRAAAAELSAREGLDAPGWYRLAVLPALLRDAAARISQEDR